MPHHHSSSSSIHAKVPDDTPSWRKDKQKPEDLVLSTISKRLGEKKADLADENEAVGKMVAAEIRTLHEPFKRRVKFAISQVIFSHQDFRIFSGDFWEMFLDFFGFLFTFWDFRIFSKLFICSWFLDLSYMNIYPAVGTFLGPISVFFSFFLFVSE